MVPLDSLDSFRAFYDAWQPFVVLVARASVDDDVAQDLAQRIFARLWRSGEWRELRSPGHYLRRAVRNEIISWSRRRTFLLLSTLSDLQLAHPSGGAEERLLAAEARANLITLVERLPPRCSQAMILRYFHGLSHREIAEEMDIGIKAVEKQMARGRRYLERPSLNAELRAILDTLIVVGGG